MDLKKWRNELSTVLNGLCSEIRINDAVIDWVDIVIEQTGSSGKCPPHAHTWYEFNYVLSGQIQTRFMDKDVMIRKGEFFLIPPGMTHSHVYFKENPLEGVCLRWRFSPSVVQTDGASMDAEELRPSADADGEQTTSSLYQRLSLLKNWPPGAHLDHYGIQPLLLRLFEEASAGCSTLYLQLLLVQFLEILASVRASHHPSTPKSAGATDALIRKVEIYLEDFQGEQLNVEELAASLHMSYGHLSRLYKQKTGRTIIEEMNRIRLTKACELLRKPSLLIKEVAEQSGFADIYYFSKAFKKKYGVSPQVYRKQELAAAELEG